MHCNLPQYIMNLWLHLYFEFQFFLNVVVSLLLLWLALHIKDRHDGKTS